MVLPELTLGEEHESRNDGIFCTKAPENGELQSCIFQTIQSRLSDRIDLKSPIVILLSGCGEPNGRETFLMARTNSNDPIVVKKYANRRLYDTSTSAYVTLEHLSSLVREGRDFVVQDAKSGEDITRAVLAQIIFEQENQKDGVLPVSFLRQLISLYGDSLTTALPAYLELSMQTFTAQQEKWRSYMSSALGEDNPARTLNDQVLKNIEMFEDAMRYFTPFAAKPTREEAPPPSPPHQDPSGDREALIALQEQMAEMQRQISRLAASRPQQKD